MSELKKSKYTVLLATPSVEIPLEIKDAAGASTTILVGYKRYDINAAKARFKVLADLRKPLSDLAKRAKEGEEVSDEEFESVQEGVEKAVDAFIKEEIIYLKKVQLMLGAEKGPAIADTRTESRVEIWSDEVKGYDDAGKPIFYKDCLDFIVDLLLLFPNYRSAFTDGFYSAISNIKIQKDAATKN